MRTQALFVAMLLALAPLPSVAQDFDVGKAAYNREDFAAALREFEPLAEQGDARAQLRLSWMYKYGIGVLQDYYTAARFARAAAVQGNPGAQWMLGIFYFTGEGVLKQNILGYMWLNIAAANGADTAGRSRDSLAKNMTTADISEAQRLSRICMESNYQDCG